MAADVAQPYDLNYSRTLGERPHQNQPFVYTNEFNACVKMAFVRDIQINIRDGIKDIGPTNQERVRILDELPGPQLPHAPRAYQIKGEPVLIQSITGYTDKNGESLVSIPYYPNKDSRVETKHASEFRAVVDKDQLRLTTQTFQQQYTYISLELGTLVLPTQTDDSYQKTYWRHHITLAYLAATDDAWKKRMFGLMHEKFTYFFRYSKGGLMIDEHHWMGRPRWCNHYRNVKLRDEEGGLNDFIHVNIIRFDWGRHSILPIQCHGDSRSRTGGATATAAQ